MESEKFAQFARENPTFQKVMQHTASKYYGTELRAGVVEVAFLLVFFPVAKYIVKEIGMPWVIEAKRLSDLHLQRLRTWIDDEYKKRGLEGKLTEAGEEFFASLAEIQNPDQQQLIEALFKEILSA